MSTSQSQSMPVPCLGKLCQMVSHPVRFHIEHHGWPCGVWPGSPQVSIRREKTAPENVSNQFTVGFWPEAIKRGFSRLVRIDASNTGSAEVTGNSGTL